MKRYQIKRLLVPIDFSRLSLYALQHAERIGKLTKSKITLLNVVERFVDSLGVDSGTLAAAMNIEQELQTRNSNVLARLAKATAKRTGLKVDAKVSIGKASTVITRTATTSKADLIVMGTHGASGFVERLLGSTTYRVATTSKVPVLSVHKQPRTGGPGNLLYPVRHGTKAMNKFPCALTFAKLFDARVHVIGPVPSDNKQLAKRMKLLCSRIEDSFAQYGLRTVSAFLPSDDFGEAILRYAGEHSRPLIAIMQDYDFRLVEVFRGSFTKKVLHRMLSPVLVIPSRT